MPPIIAPMLVPITISTGISYFSSNSNTGRCAKPLAPPPERISATDGLSAGFSGDGRTCS